MSTALPDDPALAEMVRRLVDDLDPERIYLFGSRARCEARPDSDYDLLVIVSHSNQPGYKRDQHAYRLLCGVGVSQDVIVLTRAEFDQRREVDGSLPGQVARTGVLLHAA